MSEPNLIDRIPLVFQKLVLWLLIAVSLFVVWFWYKAFQTDDTVRKDIPHLTHAQQKALDEQPTYDFYKGIDQVVPGQNPELTTEEIQGRNTWFLWTGDNSAFWDEIAQHSFGSTDLLKIIDSRHRDKRFKRFGVMNDPSMVENREADKYGLYIDKPGPGRYVPKDQELDELIYGRPSGIVGLRVFDNSEFQNSADAQARWETTCKDLYNTNVDSCSRDPKLIRPYRVGMACAFCHVGPNPINPPRDPNNPQWENMSGYTGSQYFLTGRVFFAPREWDEDVTKPGAPSRENFIWQLLNAMPPGTLDTSFIPTDSIHNPRAMNAVYEIDARIKNAQLRFSTDEFSDANYDAPGTRNEDEDKTPKLMRVPRVLQDGSDSVGVEAALARVFINIGLYHAEWTKLFKPLLGIKAQKPFQIHKANAHSAYWNATVKRMPNLVKYFQKAAKPHKLDSVKDLIKNERHKLQGIKSKPVKLGREMFENHCRECHSSKPDDVKATDAQFLDDNFLSNERRISLGEIKSNACSTLSRNAVRGEIWDNFSSETYKSLPRVASNIEFRHEDENVYGWMDTIDLLRIIGEATGVTKSVRLDRPKDDLIPPFRFTMPAGGRGYQRVPSLVSLWSTAPYLHNNSVGNYTGDPSIGGRMTAFYDGMNKLLGREKRESSAEACQNDWGAPWCPPVYRTTDDSYLIIEKSALEEIGLWNTMVKRELVSNEHPALKLGPIPKGTPVNLLASLNYRLKADLNLTSAALIDIFTQLKAQFRKLNEATDAALREGRTLSEEERNSYLKPVIPTLLKHSNCPDFVVDRGHYFGVEEMYDEQKVALIEYLKHF